MACFRCLWFAAGAVAAVAVVGCTGDDTVVAGNDAGPDASLGADAAGYETGSFDATAAPDALEGNGDAGAPPPARLLLTYDTASQGQLDVFGLTSGKVDGQILFSGGLSASGSALDTTSTTTSGAWLLEGTQDLVARLDPLQPWIVRATWNVALDDAPDAATPTPSLPDSLVATTGTQAYVLRYGRNRLAVIDTSANVDGGTPANTVDLSGQVQAAGDGVVQMLSGYFDPVTSVAYVLLSNANRAAVGPDGHTLLCGSSHPSLAAVDATKNAVVTPPVGDAGGAGFALAGYDPPPGAAPMAFDVANDRLLVLERGCLASSGDGGTTQLVRRGVEAVSLVDGSVTQLLDLSSSTAGVPRGIFYVDVHHVIVQLDGAYTWDPSTSTLGAEVAGAPQSFTLDGMGNLVGVSSQLGAEGGMTSGWSVLSVGVAADAGTTVLGQSPFTSPAGGSVGSVQLWPMP